MHLAVGGNLEVCDTFTEQRSISLRDFSLQLLDFYTGNDLVSTAAGNAVAYVRTSIRFHSSF